MQDHAPATPFDHTPLDKNMGEAGIDVLIANSKPNIRYLLGGYRFFFEHAAAIGQSRHLPLPIYRRDRPDQAVYIGHELEVHQQEVSPLWVPDARNVSSGSADAMRHVGTWAGLSIETTLCHPRRGFIKLEDTVLVTEHGSEVLGSDGRDWTRAG